MHSYRLVPAIDQCEFIVPVLCGAAIMYLLNAATPLEICRDVGHATHGTTTGSDQPQVRNELDVCHERAGTAISKPVDSISGFKTVAASTPGAKKELGKWRSSKHATWSNVLGA
jgi:hypothetical protein